MLNRIVLMMALSLVAVGQKVPDKVPEPAPIHVSEKVQNKILKAEHDLDTVQGKMKDINLNFVTKYQEVLSLKADYAETEKKVPAATKAVDDAIAEAWKESGLDKEVYDFDAATFTFSKKPTKVPEKK